MSPENESGVPEKAKNFVAPDDSQRVEDLELAHAKAIAGDYTERSVAFNEHLMHIAEELGLKGETRELAKYVKIGRESANMEEDRQTDTNINTEYREKQTERQRVAREINVTRKQLKWLFEIKNFRRVPKDKRERLVTIIQEHENRLSQLSDRLGQEIEKEEGPA